MGKNALGQTQTTIVNKDVALASCRLVEASSQSVIDEMVNDVFHKMAAGKAGLDQTWQNKT